MEAIREEKYKGHTIKIYPDDNPANPREWDNLGTMVCFHRRYTLGDKHEFSSPDDFREFWKKKEKGIIVLPLFLLDHSGLTMNTTGFSCPWDSGQVGWVYVLKEKVFEDFILVKKRWVKHVKERARRVLLSEVETYDAYLTGDVSGFVISGPECKESCWGFYGPDSDDLALEEAKGAIQAARKFKAEKLYKKYKKRWQDKKDWIYRELMDFYRCRDREGVIV